jgi:predicted ATP-binding protein involved in virulence
MRIDKIRIQNFKGFADETFHLNPRFTVFIGENGSGKTSVLDALAVAVGSFLLGIDVARLEARSIAKNEIRVSTKEGQPRPILPSIITAFGEAGSENFPGGWFRNVDAITKKTTTKFAGAKNIKETASRMLDLSRKTGEITFPVIAYHGTGRLWAEHEGIQYKKQGEGASLAYRNCLSPKSSSKDFLSWYKTYEDEVRKFDQEDDKIALRIFNECITSMIPDGRWQDMAFSFKDDDLMGILTKDSGGKEKLTFSQLSDGYRNVIGMVADVAYRCIKLNPHLGENAVKETPGIVLIDELDLHLHPKWQRRVVNDLKNAFPKVQFVATTHSPFIVQSLKANELVILGDDGFKDGEPFKKSIEEITADEMGTGQDLLRSADFLEMQKTAEEYYKLIAQGNASKTHEKTRQLREKLNELEEKFGEDPAFVASLRIERQANGL